MQPGCEAAAAVGASGVKLQRAPIPQTPPQLAGAEGVRSDQEPQVCPVDLRGPQRNPFAPGAGAQPPELAGREAIISAATIALERIRGARSEKSQMLPGLRGVGNTVLLHHIRQIAERRGYLVAPLEAPEGQRLAAYLAPKLKSILLRLSRIEQARDLAQKA